MSLISVLGAVAAGTVLALYFSPRLFKKRLVMAVFDRMDRAIPKPRPYAEQILPHSDLERVHDNLWIVRGSLPRSGPQLPRLMVVYRLPSSNQLVVHSVICVGRDVADKIDALGQVAFIIVPNRAHRLNGLAWAQRYPNARVIGPSFARQRIERQIELGATCEQVVGEYGADDQFAQEMPGVAYMLPGKERFELIYLMKLEGGSRPDSMAFVCCDLFFNIDPNQAHWMARCLGSANGFGLTALGVIVADDLGALYEWLVDLRRRVADDQLHLDSIIVAHGDPVVGADRVLAQLQVAIERLKQAL